MLARSLMCGCVEEERSQCISVRSSCDLGGGGAFDLHAISVRDRVTVDLVVGSARAEATSARSQKSGQSGVTCVPSADPNPGSYRPHRT